MRGKGILEYKNARGAQISKGKYQSHNAKLECFYKPTSLQAYAITRIRDKGKSQKAKFKTTVQNSKI